MNAPHAPQGAANTPLTLDFDWPTDPMEIERRSLAIIDAETPRPLPCTEEQWPVLRRMIHASADFDLLSAVRFHPDAVATGVQALLSGARIATDTHMCQCGMPQRRLDPLGCRTACLTGDARVAEHAKAQGITRAMAAVDLLLEESPNIWVIGNAPTALLRLLSRLRDGAPAPALIIGMPVGFVSAAESKELLASLAPVPFITVLGRKGGSPLAAACLNALADLALSRQPKGASQPA